MTEETWSIEAAWINDTIRMANTFSEKPRERVAILICACVISLKATGVEKAEAIRIFDMMYDNNRFIPVPLDEAP
jgi:hypothetical protein